jgi:hypothetical protein
MVPLVQVSFRCRWVWKAAAQRCEPYRMIVALASVEWYLLIESSLGIPHSVNPAVQLLMPPLIEGVYYRSER